MICDNYPPGAANDPNAPYNQVSTPFEDFEVSVSCIMYSDAHISSDDYILEVCDADEEFGRSTTEAYYQGDAAKEFKEQHHTPMELLRMLSTRAKKDIENLDKSDKFYERKKKDLESIIDDCEIWYNEEIENQ